MDADEIPSDLSHHGSTLAASMESDESSCPKKRKGRMSEAEKLSVSTSSSERSRKGSTEHCALAVGSPAPRSRPEPGSLKDQGIYAHHIRPKGRGLWNWRQYGNLPHARTQEILNKDGNIVTQKVFEWRGLFKDINGRKKFVEGKKGAATICLTEAQIDFWDRVRIKWLAKIYGRHYLLDWAPTESLVRTWHTSEKFIICFMKVPAFLFLLL